MGPADATQPEPVSAGIRSNRPPGVPGCETGSGTRAAAGEPLVSTFLVRRTATDGRIPVAASFTVECQLHPIAYPRQRLEPRSVCAEFSAESLRLGIKRGLLEFRYT